MPYLSYLVLPVIAMDATLVIYLTTRQTINIDNIEKHGSQTLKIINTGFGLGAWVGFFLCFCLVCRFVLCPLGLGGCVWCVLGLCGVRVVIHCLQLLWSNAICVVWLVGLMLRVVGISKVTESFDWRACLGFVVDAS